jgi:hypothetical protein
MQNNDRRERKINCEMKEIKEHSWHYYKDTIDSEFEPWTYTKLFV